MFGLPYSQPFFAALFPDFTAPVYQQESFAALALAHFWLVGISEFVCLRRGGRRRRGIRGHARKWKEFRHTVETIAAVGRGLSAGRGTGDRAVPVMGLVSSGHYV